MTTITAVMTIGIIDAIMVWALMKLTKKENEYFDEISEKEFDSKR